jgi:putative Mg2+ transporter-C (MgtC) family protein
MIFHDVVDVNSVLMVVTRLVVAVILGGIVGFERQAEGKSAGIRTHMLVALGAALFAVAPLAGGMPFADFSRVVQGVATGIGFLGAGAILKAGEQHIHGLTTAASIWLTAAAGLSVGAGYLIPGVVAILLGWIVLEPVEWLEKKYMSSRRHNL